MFTDAEPSSHDPSFGIQWWVWSMGGAGWPMTFSELRLLSVYLLFDTSRLAATRKMVRAPQDDLTQLLRLGAAVEDRLGR